MKGLYMQKLNTNELMIINGSKYYGNHRIFSDLSFSVNRDSKITIVGENGAGKSTLLKILIGDEKLTDGEITYKSDILIKYLPQDLLIYENKSVLDFLTDDIPDLNFIAKLIVEELIISNATNNKNLSNDMQNNKNLSDLWKKFNEEEGYKLYKILSGLKISDIPFTKSLDQISGGERTKLALAKLLLQEPDIIILDEPTNHLDIHAIAYLEKYLLQIDSAIILVTHDRTLLQNITNHIIEIENGIIVNFKGTYKAFLEDKRRKQEKALQEYQNLKKEEKELKNLVAVKKQKLFNKPQMRDNCKVTYNVRAQSASRAISKDIRKRASRLDIINDLTAVKPEKIKEFNYKLENIQGVNKQLMICEMQNISYKIGDKQILNNFSKEIYAGQKILIKGINGSGKTTLLKILIGEIKPDSGKINFISDIKIGYLDQLNLNIDSKVIELICKNHNLSESDALDILYKYCLFTRDIAYKNISDLSIGQQRRLQFANILLGNPDILILDEPTNHLDYITCEYLENQLLSFNGTVLAVSHDRYFINKFDADDVWAL
jgi:ATPase subunit of ABC transporter with duplicated ATPase domains